MLNTVLLSHGIVNSQTHMTADMIQVKSASDVVVVVNHCFTSLFGTKGLLSDIIIR